MSGYVKLHRKMLESVIWQDENSDTFKVFCFCLMSATHKESTILRGGNKIVLKPGQFMYSRKSWAKKLNVKESTLRNIMQRLVFWDTLEDTFKDKGLATVFQVTNWDKYQRQDILEDTFKDSQRTTRGQLEDTFKNVKKEKNDKNIRIDTLQENPAEEVTSPYIELWEKVMQTKIRTNVEKNLNAASKLSALLGDDTKLGEFLLFCRTTRQDKYAGQYLIIATANYLGILKNLETLEAKYAATKDSRSSFSEIITMSPDERRFWGSPV